MHTRCPDVRDRTADTGARPPPQSYASGRVLVKFKDNTVRTMSDDQLGLKFTRSAVDSVGVYDIIDDSTVAEKVAKLSTLQSGCTWHRVLGKGANGTCT